jgi:hypothetical protein
MAWARSDASAGTIHPPTEIAEHACSTTVPRVVRLHSPHLPGRRNRRLRSGGSDREAGFSLARRIQARIPPYGFGRRGALNGRLRPG